MVAAGKTWYRDKRPSGAGTWGKIAAPVCCDQFAGDAGWCGASVTLRGFKMTTCAAIFGGQLWHKLSYLYSLILQHDCHSDTPDQRVWLCLLNCCWLGQPWTFSFSVGMALCQQKQNKYDSAKKSGLMMEAQMVTAVLTYFRSDVLCFRLVHTASHRTGAGHSHGFRWSCGG